MRAYILIETDTGKTKAVATAIAQLKGEGVRVIGVDTVTGPYDVILHIETDLPPETDVLDRFRSIEPAYVGVDGIQKTTTCIAVRLP